MDTWSPRVSLKAGDIVIDDPHDLTRGRLQTSIERFLALLPPITGGALFSPRDEFDVLYLGPGLEAKRVDRDGRTFVRLSAQGMSSPQSFSFTPQEWNQLLEASAKVEHALSTGEGFSWTQLVPAQEQVA